MAYRIEIKVRNAPLYRAVTAHHKTVAEFCRAHDFRQSLIGDLLNLKRSPIRANGEWTKTAKKLADITGLLPDELFPDACQIRLEKNVAAFEASPEQVAAIMAPDDPERALSFEEMKRDVRRSVSRLYPSLRKVLILRFGLNGDEPQTLEQIAKQIGVTRERVRQLEMKGMRRLRESARPLGRDAVLLDHLKDE
jgi:RNA polymerase sigma factor (sigma-70 family)